MELGLNIDPENIRGSVKIIAALTCPICSLLLRSPVMRCEECGNYFCQSCLGDWWSKEGEAGKCIYKCNTNELKVMKREAIFSPMLELLEFPCQNKGCIEISTHQTLKKHIEECEFTPMKCQHCQATNSRRQMKSHDDQCQLKPLPCQHCASVFPRKQIGEHEKSCPLKKLKCENDGCEQMCTLELMPEHNEQCGYKKMACDWCSVSLIKKKLDDHNNGCMFRKITCKGCQNNFLQEQLIPHIQVCQQIKVQCQVCNNRYSRKQISSTHNINTCLINQVRQLRKENISLRQSNIQLKLMMQNIQYKYQQLSNQARKSSLKHQKSLNLQGPVKDFQRLENSILSLQKLKAEEFSSHMKKPHIFGDWCPICKQIDRKFAKLIEPLETQRKQISTFIKTIKNHGKSD